MGAWARIHFISKNRKSIVHTGDIMESSEDKSPEIDTSESSVSPLYRTCVCSKFENQVMRYVGSFSTVWNP